MSGRLGCILSGCLTALLCFAASPVTPGPSLEAKKDMFRIESPAFRDGEQVPTKYSGEGQDVSPPLRWSGVPAGARELVLVCEDPDAPMAEPFVHWVIYGMSPMQMALPEGVPTKPMLSKPFTAKQGRNSMGKIGYTGPMPPPGHGPHRYFFMLYALDAKLNLPAGVKKQDLMNAIKPHIIGFTQVIGKYERPAQKAAG
jgi:Raf kinase inhibitor-like YbhB/YbcL family protein